MWVPPPLYKVVMSGTGNQWPKKVLNNHLVLVGLLYSSVAFKVAVLHKDLAQICGVRNKLEDDLETLYSLKCGFVQINSIFLPKEMLLYRKVN